MALKTPSNLNIENFTIKDNILKGIEVEVDESGQVGSLIFDTLSSAPDHIAQIDADTDRKTTYAEMKDRSSRCGLWMKEQGIRPGDVVTVCSNNHLDTYVPIFGTFYVGAIFTGWDDQLSLKTARQLMKFYEPKLMFSCESAVSVLLEASKLEKVTIDIVVFGNYPNLKSLDKIIETYSAEKIEKFRPMRIENPGETAIILLTSGSTGPPKGVQHSYKNVLKLAQIFTPRPISGICLCVSTVYWLTGIMFVLVPIFTNGTRIIMDKWNIEKICKVIQKYKVERIFMSPVMVTYLYKSGALDKFDLTSVQYIFTGGAKGNQRALKECKRRLPNASIIQSYGLSETGRMIASQTEHTKNVDSVGFVMSNTQLKIIDVEDKRTLGPNEQGEICVKQPTVMRGYYKNPGETDKVIDENGWLHTGDKGYFDDNGEITITDRIKDVIKCRNYQISPVELEEVLASHPAVMEVAVVPIPHEIDTEQPLAFVKKSADVTEDELIALTLVLGENRKLRGGVQFVKEIPKTPSGKIDKPSLKEIAKILHQDRQRRTNTLNI